MADLVLFPNCDIHVALHGTPTLKFRVALRDEDPSHLKNTLTEVTNQCAVDFFAPYNPVGNRLQRFVNIDLNAGTITPSAIGINIIQVRFQSLYILARIQVHDTIQDWWFGNASITTAKDANFAHAQPSIYARFSDDASHTDLVGDITGHGYVALTSSDPATLAVNADGRLQGLAEAVEADHKSVSGTFLGKTQSIPVKVVDYGKRRMSCEYVQTPNINNLDAMHNILFVAEGFRDTDEDRDKFNSIVGDIVDEMFSKPRHAPYNMLDASFNVFKAYETSAQHCLTCGFRVTAADVALPGMNGTLKKGTPIPAPTSISKDPNIYTIEELVQIVGLPLRAEARDTAQLTALWSSQSLMRFDVGTNAWVNNFDPARVNDDLVAAWTAQASVGILEARDTIFGIILGFRPGDRLAGASDPPITEPPADSPGVPLFTFISRVYEWFNIEGPRTMSPDIRRHPPELSTPGGRNLGAAVLSYIGNLWTQFAPAINAGAQWLPDPTGASFKRSPGLVALITNESMLGGTNMGHLITANTLNADSNLSFDFASTGTQNFMRRTPDDSIKSETGHIIDTVAHEFGHTFHLDDEYEDFAGDQPSLPGDFDNRCVLSEVNLDANFAADRLIDPSKVKWFDLLRMDVADVLAKDSEFTGGSLKLTIDKRTISRWAEAKKQNKQANVRRSITAANGRQLPLSFAEDDYIAALDIESVDEAQGVVMLGGLNLPPTVPTFPAGSIVFVPKLDSSNRPVAVVEKAVLDALTALHKPLNKDPDTTHVNKDEDDPFDIANFKPPCKSYKVIGIYEGAGTFTGMVYRPAGLCKMRKIDDQGTGDGEFCHVCKYLIVNRVDPSFLAIMDKKYYPSAK
jgi:hypothetical protein